ncbi:MAG: hypothetical protein FD153_313 [Rhodospirillaceae bacterium]|nr:MAG: hypothetical protein FD153_313 [Rhodospirillaceae bacterium]
MLQDAGMISHHAALIYAMVLVSAADGDRSDTGLHVISELVSFLPVFRDYDSRLLPETVGACVEIMEQEHSLDEAMTVIRASVPKSLRDDGLHNCLRSGCCRRSPGAGRVTPAGSYARYHGAVYTCDSSNRTRGTGPLCPPARRRTGREEKRMILLILLCQRT